MTWKVLATEHDQTNARRGMQQLNRRQVVRNHRQGGNARQQSGERQSRRCIVEQERLAWLDHRQRIVRESLLFRFRGRQPVADITLEETRRLGGCTTPNLAQYTLSLELIQVPVDGHHAYIKARCQVSGGDGLVGQDDLGDPLPTLRGRERWQHCRLTLLQRFRQCPHRIRLAMGQPEPSCRYLQECNTGICYFIIALDESPAHHGNADLAAASPVSGPGLAPYSNRATLALTYFAC